MSDSHPVGLSSPTVGDLKQLLADQPDDKPVHVLFHAGPPSGPHAVMYLPIDCINVNSDTIEFFGVLAYAYPTYADTKDAGSYDLIDPTDEPSTN